MDDDTQAKCRAIAEFRTCATCGCLFRVKLWRLKQTPAEYCSPGCVARRPRQNRDSERFWAKVEKTDGCWLWTGAICEDGYGRFHVDGHNGRAVLAHRWTYQETHGEIAQGKQIDHLCRRRRCVRPDHLEVVTQAENIARGEGFSARNSRTTHCVHGHPFDPRDTYVNPHRRYCRECNRQKVARYASEQRAEM